MNAGFASPLFLLGFASDERVFIDIPGLEYTMPDNKLHFALPINRLHFTFPDEDRQVGKTALQVREVITGESRLASVDLSGLLDAGETLSGTPTVEEVDTADLSFSGETANGVALTINGVTVAINHAVQFVVNAANAVAGEHYLVEVTCSTSASQTVKGYLRIHCVV